MGLHEKLFGRVAELNELNVRIQWIGRPFDSPEAKTPRYVQRAIRKAIADTSKNTGMVLTVAFDYGGRSELVAAVEGARDVPATVSPTVPIADHLYLPELPPVDVLVRTSGEHRVSNFLLWQSAGAAIYFTDSAVARLRRRRTRRRTRAHLSVRTIDVVAPMRSRTSSYSADPLRH